MDGDLLLLAHSPEKQQSASEPVSPRATQPVGLPVTAAATQVVTALGAAANPAASAFIFSAQELPASASKKRRTDSSPTPLQHATDALKMTPAVRRAIGCLQSRLNSMHREHAEKDRLVQQLLQRVGQLEDSLASMRAPTRMHQPESSLPGRIGSLEEACSELKVGLLGVQGDVAALKQQAPSPRDAHVDGGAIHGLSEAVAQVREVQRQQSEQVARVAGQAQRLEKDAVNRTFKVVPTKIADDGRAREVPAGDSPMARVRAVLGNLQGLGQVAIDRVQELKKPEQKDILIFRVTSLADAEQIRSERKALKGAGFAIMDMLTREEFATFKALQPQAAAALETNKKVQWRRSRLYIDGREVKLAEGAAQQGAAQEGARAQGPGAHAGVAQGAGSDPGAPARPSPEAPRGSHGSDDRAESGGGWTTVMPRGRGRGRAEGRGRGGRGASSGPGRGRGGRTGAQGGPK